MRSEAKTLGAGAGQKRHQGANRVALQVQNMAAGRSAQRIEPDLEVFGRHLQRLVDDRAHTVRLDHNDTTRQSGAGLARACRQHDSTVGQQRGRPIAVRIVAEQRHHLGCDDAGSAEASGGDRYVSSTAA